MKSERLVATIRETLAVFGLPLTFGQSNWLSTLYVLLRSETTADELSEIFIMATPANAWLPDDTNDTKLAVMSTLIDCLDGRYLMAKLEPHLRTAGSEDRFR